MKIFEESGYLAQVNRSRRLAEQALKRYQLKVKKIDFINHGENTTFKVEDQRGKNYLLRIHRAGYHTSAAINEELKWLEDISLRTDLIVPKPIRSKNNKLVESIYLEAMGRERNICLFHWIDGKFVWKSLSERHLCLIGKNMGILQKFTGNRKTKHRQYWAAEGLLGDQAKMGPITNLVMVTPAQQKFLLEKRDEVFNVLNNYEQKYPHRMGLVHTDMHFGNIVFNKDQVGIIDFDDCGHGAYMYDLTTPLIVAEYVLKERKEFKFMSQYQEALLNAYSEFMPLDQKDIDMILYYRKARSLLMLGWLQNRMDNPRLKKRFKENLERSIRFLEEN